MSKKRKYYVVWQGRQRGIFTEWSECEAQIKGFVDAKFKSFDTLAEAEKAVNENYNSHISFKKPTIPNPSLIPAAIGKPIGESISVDAAWNTATGVVEYQGVFTRTKELIFHRGPLADGTNNIGEFLAIVHGLAYLKQYNSELPLYSDSKTAIGWVKKKHANTKLALTEANKPLFEMLQRAERWLVDNTFKTKILKWETEYWGENPADFGRK
jgi:ribonuclease HI